MTQLSSFPGEFDKAVIDRTHSSSLIQSSTRDAGNLKPCLAVPTSSALGKPGKQWSPEYPINIPAELMLCEADLCYQEALDWP